MESQIVVTSSAPTAFAMSWFGSSPVPDPPPSAPSAHAGAAEAEKVSLVGKRVVIVEDEGITQLQLGRILRSAGMEVVGTAPNGQQGVEVVLSTLPDLVLMDINMPVMDGLEAARLIQAQIRTCIVMLTAYSNEEHLQSAQELGACGYVVKPVDSYALLPELRAALLRCPWRAEPLA